MGISLAFSKPCQCGHAELESGWPQVSKRHETLHHHCTRCSVNPIPLADGSPGRRCSRGREAAQHRIDLGRRPRDQRPRLLWAEGPRDAELGRAGVAGDAIRVRLYGPADLLAVTGGDHDRQVPGALELDELPSRSR